MKKLLFTMLFLSLTLIGFSQSQPTEKKLFIPPLPEMSYAQVTDKSKFNVTTYAVGQLYDNGRCRCNSHFCLFEKYQTCQKPCISTDYA